MTVEALPETVLPKRAGNGTRTYQTLLSEPVWAGGWVTSYGPRAKVSGVHRWYDPETRSWVVYAIDTNGHQVGQSEYVYSAAEAKQEVAATIAEVLSNSTPLTQPRTSADPISPTAEQPVAATQTGASPMTTETLTPRTNTRDLKEWTTVEGDLVIARKVDLGTWRVTVTANDPDLTQVQGIVFRNIAGFAGRQWESAIDGQQHPSLISAVREAVSMARRQADIAAFAQAEHEARMAAFHARVGTEPVTKVEEIDPDEVGWFRLSDMGDGTFRVDDTSGTIKSLTFGGPTAEAMAREAAIALNHAMAVGEDDLNAERATWLPTARASIGQDPETGAEPTPVDIVDVIARALTPVAGAEPVDFQRAQAEAIIKALEVAGAVILDSCARCGEDPRSHWCADIEETFN